MPLDLTTPQPLDAAVRGISAKTPIGAKLRDRDWQEKVQGKLKEEGFWSAGLESIKALERLQTGIGQILGEVRDARHGGYAMDRGKLIAQVQKFANAEEHTLAAGLGPALTLAEWGFISARCTRSGDGLELLTLIAERAPADAPLFALRQTITLYDVNGLVRFRGTVRLPKMSARAKVRRHTYVAEGVAWDLKQLVYRQLWNIASVSEVTGEVSTTAVALTKVILFRTPAGAPISLKDQVIAILDYAIEQGVDLVYDATHLPTYRPPGDAQLDLRCWDALQVVLGWAPDVNVGVRYMLDGTPEIYFSRARMIGSVGVDGPSSFQERQVRLSDLENFECTPRDDLLVHKMIVKWLRPVQVPVEGQRPRYPLNVFSETSTVINGVETEMESTIRLPDLAWLGNGWAPPEEEPLAGLAEALHRGFAKLGYELKLTKAAQSVSWAEVPGERWSVLDAGAEMADAWSICQSIDRDLGSGTMEIQCGLGTRLALSAMVQLLRPNRKRGVPDSQGEQQTGFGKDDERADREAKLAALRRGFTVYDAGDSFKVVPCKLNNEDPDTVGGSADWTFSRVQQVIYLRIVITSATNVVTLRQLCTGSSVPAPTSDATTHTGCLELATIGEDLVPVQAADGFQWARVDLIDVVCADGSITKTRSLSW